MKSKTLGISVAVVAFLLLSVATLVPVTALPTEDEDELIDVDFGSLDTSSLDSKIIYWSWFHFNDETFRAKLNEAKAQIDVEINKFSEEDRILIREFFDIDSAFSLDGIFSRISSLRPLHVMHDVQQGLLEVPDNYDDYNETRQEPIAKYLEIWYNNDFGNETMFYPFVNLLTVILKAFSLIWTVPLVVLLGLIGLVIASFITVIFFSPIIVSAGLYIGACEALQNDEELREKLKNIAFVSGLIGLTTVGSAVLLSTMFKDGWVKQGWKYVLDRILILSLGEDGNIIIGERAPWIQQCTIPSTGTVGKPIKVSLEVYDQDWVYKSEAPNYERPRDYLQVGWDWNNDGEIDEWTELVDPYQGSNLAVAQITTYHTFDTDGTHIIKVTPRDIWGLDGDTKSYMIVVTKTGNSEMCLLSQSEMLLLSQQYSFYQNNYDAVMLDGFFTAR